MRLVGFLCIAVLIIEASVSKQISVKEIRAAIEKDAVGAIEDGAGEGIGGEEVTGGEEEVAGGEEDGTGEEIVSGGEDEDWDGTGDGVEVGGEVEGEDEATDDESSTCDGYKPAACGSCTEINVRI